MIRKLTCIITAVLACMLVSVASAGEATPRPKPTVRPLEVHFDYRLPSTRLTEENFEDFFLIELGGEYSRGQDLHIPYTITPREPYDQYDGSSIRIAVRLEISVFLTEDAEEPYFVKRYIDLLHRTKGYRSSGVIDVLLKLDQDDIWYTCKVHSCNGLVGLDGWDPAE